MDLENNSEILQNLKDAGCSSRFIEDFFKLKLNGSSKMLIRMLNKHKTALLEHLHRTQKEIDCLDFLIFQIRRKFDS